MRIPALSTAVALGAGALLGWLAATGAFEAARPASAGQEDQSVAPGKAAEKVLPCCETGMKRHP